MKSELIGYVLMAEGLLSKWGFGDGDGLQDYLYDLVDGGLITHNMIPERDKLLAWAVDTYLMPELVRRGIKVELLAIGSNHNPVRALRVNGHDVDWYDDSSWPAKDELRGIEVLVPHEAILGRLKR